MSNSTESLIGKLEELKWTESLGDHACPNYTIDQCIAIIRSHAATDQQREIPSLKEVETHPWDKSKWTPSPEEKQPVPVSVSLEKCAEALHRYDETGYAWFERAASNEGKVIQIQYRNRARYMLTSEGIPYVE